MLAFCLAYSSTVKVEAKYSFHAIEIFIAAAVRTSHTMIVHAIDDDSTNSEFLISLWCLIRNQVITALLTVLNTMRRNLLHFGFGLSRSHVQYRPQQGILCATSCIPAMTNSGAYYLELMNCMWNGCDQYCTVFEFTKTVSGNERQTRCDTELPQKESIEE
jgi:hypothetical protein